MKDQTEDRKREYVFKTIDSPIGVLKLVVNDSGLAAILWANEDPRRVRLNIVGEDNTHPVLVQVERQLGEYFRGERRAFDLKLNFSGTPFQNKVWEALLRIPYGQTRSYGEIARELAHPKAVRAVGAANGRNPIAVVAPWRFGRIDRLHRRFEGERASPRFREGRPTSLGNGWNRCGMRGSEVARRSVGATIRYT